MSTSALARRASALVWSWGGNSQGMVFRLPPGGREGVLETPWGSGTWGVVASRGDVLVAMFAQQRHMLQFDRHEPMFNSTRCADGDFVRARAIRGVDGGNARATGEWWRGNAREG